MTEKKTESALLVATYERLKDLHECEEHLEELSLLAETFGVETAKAVPCSIRKINAATYLNKGKLAELIEMANELYVDVVIFDEEISPAQQRNLEKAFGRSVIDRTELILGVFAQRAHTKAARLQVELAQMRYQMPRLKRLWTHLERQSGTAGGGTGGGYLKGMGEKQIEVDKRLIQQRIDRLKKGLQEVHSSREVQRHQRERKGVPVFAIVGYTNAGKSTLLNALTEAGVLTEDKLFATLDTTTRRFELANHQTVLLSDTVGFIRKLPHLLVESFKSTLDEALEADVLLHVIDVSHPMAVEQSTASYEVLKELGAHQKPIITVFNKVDACTDKRALTELRLTYIKSVIVSAKDQTGFEDLQERMIQEIRKWRVRMKLRIPQKEYQNVSRALDQGEVVEIDYDGNDVLLEVDVPASLEGPMQKYLRNE